MHRYIHTDMSHSLKWSKRLKTDSVRDSRDMGTVPTLTARERQSPQSACRSERTITVCRETEGEKGKLENLAMIARVQGFLGQAGTSKCLFMNSLIHLFHAGAKDVGANGSGVGGIGGRGKRKYLRKSCWER